MASKGLEKLADKIIKLSPEEGEQLALIIQAKLMPEIQRQRQGLLEQQFINTLSKENSIKTTRYIVYQEKELLIDIGTVLIY